ncbi:hypothetical protein GCM10010315_27190 [Streptomyces luteosporeus]|uniref:Uncharacterized protein n=1 Tax=Streptomyces luteosporeus TaxID=173856 RepID=A0ABN3TQ52_9ACTN
MVPSRRRNRSGRRRRQYGRCVSKAIRPTWTSTDAPVTQGNCTYCSGIEHGRQQEWWPDGTKRAEGVTIMGAAVGEWRYWHANGRPSEVVVSMRTVGRCREKRWNAVGELIMDHVTRRA